MKSTALPPSEVFRGYRVAISESLLKRVRSIPEASMMPNPHEDSIAARLHDLLHVAAVAYLLRAQGRSTADLFLRCEITVPLLSETIVKYMAIVQPSIKVVTCMATGAEAVRPLAPFPIDELDWAEKTLVPFSPEEEKRMRG